MFPALQCRRNSTGPSHAYRSDSGFSFLNYLKSNARLEQFFCSSSIFSTRQEFEDYFNWVAAQIPDIVFSVNVDSVDYDPQTNLFVVQADPQSTYASKHIVLGCGAEPKSSVEKPTRKVANVSTLLSFNFPDPLQRVLVVGGGQSAAECINYLLDEYANAGTQIKWVTSETAFRVLDISNFSREVFSASYAHACCGSSQSAQRKIVHDDKACERYLTSRRSALINDCNRLKYLSPSGRQAHRFISQVIQEVLESSKTKKARR